MPQKNKELVLKEICPKELLFIDLCARLPYGFTVHRYSDNRNITFEKNELDEFSHFLEYSEGKEFKPYLRSMSTMTEEEVKEEDNTVMMFLQDFYNSHHLDYRGLIPMGLALEAPEGMYKNE